MKKGLQSGDKQFSLMLLSPAVIITVIFILVPVADSIYRSFFDYKVKNIISGKPGTWKTSYRNDQYSVIRIWCCNCTVHSGYGFSTGIKYQHPLFKIHQKYHDDSVGGSDIDLRFSLVMDVPATVWFSKILR